MLERNRSPATAALYEGHVQRCLALADPLSPIRNQNASPKGRHSVLAAMRAWARFAGDEKLAAKLKDMAETLPKAVHLVAKQPLTLAQRDAFLAAVDKSKEQPAVRGVLGVMATRGLRVGDVLRLTRKEVQRGAEEGKLFGAAKGGRRKEYEVTEDTIEYLQLFLEGNEKWARVGDLLAGAADELRQRRTAVQLVERACARVAKSAGLKGVHPHRLRATYARLYLDAIGGDITYLTAHMGWESVQTALGYVEHVNPSKAREAGYLPTPDGWGSCQRRRYIISTPGPHTFCPINRTATTALIRRNWSGGWRAGALPQSFTPRRGKPQATWVFLRPNADNRGRWAGSGV
jgi:integrase